MTARRSRADSDPATPSSGDNGATTQRSDHADLPVKIVLAIGFAVVVGLQVATANRGFDVSDEGFYALTYHQPDESHVLLTQFHRVMRLVTGPFEFGLVGLRVSRIVLMAASSAVLGWSVHRFVARKLPTLATAMPGPRATALLVALVGLADTTFVPRSLSYNSLSAAVASLVVGLVLLSMAESTRRGSGFTLPKVDWRLALAGALLAIQVYVKWPVAVSLGAAVVGAGALMVGPWFALRQLRDLAVGAAAGFVSAYVLADLTPGRLVSGEERLREQESVGTLLNHYLSDAVTNAKVLVGHRPLLMLGLIAILGATTMRTLPPALRRLATALGTVALGAYLLVGVGLDDGREHEFLLLATVLASSLAVAVTARWWRQADDSRLEARQTAVLLVGLFVLPFIVGVGTVNALMRQTMASPAGFGAGLVVAIAAVGSTRASSSEALRRTCVAVAVLVAVVAVQTFQGTFVEPYGEPGSLADADVVVSGLGPIDGIRVHPEIANALDLLDRATREAGFVPGDRVLALSGVPGYVYAIDATAPAIAWTAARDGANHVNCANLGRAPDEVAATRIVLVVDQVHPDLASCLTDMWPAFASDLQLFGSTTVDGEDISVYVVK